MNIFCTVENVIGEIRNTDYNEVFSTNIPSPVLNRVLDKYVNGLRGNELKNYEDTQDAVFCSYLAYYTWANPEKCHVYGNMNERYICSPIK